MERCPYYNCKNMCRNIDSHKAYYANLRKKDISTLKKVEEVEEEKPRSSKVNWEIYEKFIQTGLIKIGKT